MRSDFGLAWGSGWHGGAGPLRYAALAAWDAAGHRNDAVSSAFIFAGEPAIHDDPGRLLHLERTEELARFAAARLESDLPLPRVRWTWLGAVVVVGFAFTPWLKPLISAGDLPLTAAMIEAARAEAGEIAKAGDQKPDQRGLTDEERKRLEELQKQMQDLAARLQNAEGRTPREVLDELEKQARAAEALAHELGADRNAWASEEILREMRRHPDTANLADAVANKNAGHASVESKELATRLGDPDLTTETAERVKAALDRTMQKAQDEDKKKMVGQHVGEAERKMEEDQPVGAGGGISETCRQVRAARATRECAEGTRKARRAIAAIGEFDRRSQKRGHEETRRKRIRSIIDTADGPIGSGD